MKNSGKFCSREYFKYPKCRLLLLSTRYFIEVNLLRHVSLVSKNVLICIKNENYNKGIVFAFDFHLFSLVIFDRFSSTATFCIVISKSFFLLVKCFSYDLSYACFWSLTFSPQLRADTFSCVHPSFIHL